MYRSRRKVMTLPGLICLIGILWTSSAPAHAQKGGQIIAVPPGWENVVTLEVAPDGSSAYGWARVAGKGRHWSWSDGKPIVLGETVSTAGLASKRQEWIDSALTATKQAFVSLADDQLGKVTEGPDASLLTGRWKLTSYAASEDGGVAACLDPSNNQVSVVTEAYTYSLEASFYSKERSRAYDSVKNALSGDLQGLIGIARDGVTIVVCGPADLVVLRNSQPAWKVSCLSGSPVTTIAAANVSQIPQSTTAANVQGGTRLTLSGTVQSTNLTGFILLVRNVTLPDGKVAQLRPARTKTILISAGTSLPNGLKRGSAVTVSGTDNEQTKVLTANTIEMEH